MKDGIPTELIHAACREVSASLREDLCSYGWLRHLVTPLLPPDVNLRTLEKEVVANLLASEIEIGETFRAVKNGKEYVGFRAWNGSIESRMDRAFQLADSSSPPDVDWSFWLCLKQNVDEQETCIEQPKRN